MFLCHSALIITQLFIVTLFAAGQKLVAVLALDLNEVDNNTQPLTSMMGVSAAV
jgi:hypothetical protein|tara:strand:+ start:147 stop:308 length:162 start_codon:yes stop_codon:yes gene_type:complete